MNSIEKPLRELYTIRNLQQRSHWMNALHPLGKLLLSIGYILIVVSVHRYDLAGLILKAVYPVFGFIVGELSLKDGLRRMKLILPLVMFVGIFNPFFDHTPLGCIGGFVITGGMVSMVTLMLKGFYAVLGAYLLIATTSIEEICYALQLLHIPHLLIVVVMLIDRYFVILGEEAVRIFVAYQLRAPKQRGIHFKAWGTLVGQWLLRSFDRANLVYEAMLLRGFRGGDGGREGYDTNGEKTGEERNEKPRFTLKEKELRPLDVVYPAAWLLLLLII